MKQIFNWLRPDRARYAQTEAKASQPFVTIQAGGLAAWSVFSCHSSKDGFATNPIVYRCVRLISEAAASVPFAIPDGQGEPQGQRVLDVLEYPNERQSRSRFLESLFGYLLLCGNAHVVRIASSREMEELHVLDPAKVTSVLDHRGWPLAYDYQAGGLRTRYAAGPGGDILHLALFNPGSEVNGTSPLSAAHKAVDIHNAASTWNKALLDNSARPSGALIYSSGRNTHMSDSQFERLKSELETGYSGAERAGRPMLLEGGLDWKAMGYSPRDMDFLEAKNGAAREIALAFGVPPMLLGIPGDNTYSNYQEANRALWSQTILPLAVKTAADLGHWLGTFYGKPVKLHLDTEGIAALSKEREAYWNRIGNASFLTDDEKRASLGFAPIEGDTHV